MKKFSNVKLKEIRLSKNLTQAKVAKAIGVSEVTYGLWEKGKFIPSQLNQKKLIKFFDCYNGELFEEVHSLNEEEAGEYVFDFKKLKKRRLELKLTKKDVASKINVLWNTYNLWEEGACVPKEDNIEKLCDVLGFNKDELLIKVENTEKLEFNNLKLKEARLRLNLSQEEFAEKLGISFVTYGLWERGKFTPTQENIEKIKNTLNLSENDLFVKKENKIEAVNRQSFNFNKEELTRLRVEFNETQTELAIFLGVTLSTVTKWERGDRKPSINKIKKIAKHYATSKEEIKEIMNRLMN